MTLSPGIDRMTAASGSEAPVELVSMHVAGQLVGIPVRTVRDVLGPQRLARVPRASPEIAGVLNLRGRIVTAVDLRARLGIPPVSRAGARTSVVVEHRDELYSLLIDQVGEVLRIAADRFERDPVGLRPGWRDVAVGIYRLDDALLVELDVGRILDFTCSA